MSAFETVALILDIAVLFDERGIEPLLWLGLPPAEYQVAAVT
jgi:hypothetical protein